ncbi:dentin sialophosphoprotein-like [Scomber japonicus]|uniref:dentin sialophosphoprotein-like n=1 Tax=Scomber japonicus TaxID=13676 RepID=UPI0023063537|nr:dentin sialophosphoprotein-like [Scomber japonicus]
MPASKRGSSPHDSQPKMRKLDEDAEALQPKTAPATNNKPHKTGNMQETTAAPRTKKKPSASAEGENKPAKSSIQTSPPKDSSKTISEPPVKKAKLLKATSASCGEAPSMKALCKAPVKRTASTESDEDLSSDGSKTDLFRERDDGDKARCIRQYSNRVRAKRQAEETCTDPQETCQELSPTPSDPVQMDHNYGRFTDLLGGQNLDETVQNEDKPAEPDTEAQRQENSESKEALAEEIGQLKHLESQNLIDKTSSTQILDSISGAESSIEVNENKDVAESIKSQTGLDNETLPLSVKTICSSSGEAKQCSESEDQTDEKVDSVCRPESQTDLSCETDTKEPTVSGSDVKYETDESEHEVKGETEAGVEARALPNETNSTPEEMLMGNHNPKSQTDLSVKIQVTFKEESKSNQVPDAITNSCDGVNKIVKKSEEQLEESERKGAEFLSAQSAAGPESFVEVQLSHDAREVKAKTTDSCTETSKTTSEDRADPALKERSENQETGNFNDTTDTPVDVKEGVANSTSLGKEETDIECTAAHIQASAASALSNPASSSLEIQGQTNREVSEPTTDISRGFHDEHVVVKSTVMENEDRMSVDSASGRESQNIIEMQTLTAADTSADVSKSTSDVSDSVTAPFKSSEDEGRIPSECVAAPENQIEEISNSETGPTEKTQSQNIHEVSEPTTDACTESHEEQTVGTSTITENTHSFESDMQKRTEEISIIAPTAEMQSQQIPEVSEHNTDVQPELSENLTEKSQNMENVKFECASSSESQINMKMQTTSNPLPMTETQSQNIQGVSEPNTDVCSEFHEDQKVDASSIRENVNSFESVAAAAESQSERYLQTSQTSETSNPAPSQEMQSQGSQIDSDTQTRTEEISIIAQTAMQSQQIRGVSEHNTVIPPGVQNMGKVDFECASVSETQMQTTEEISIKSEHISSEVAVKNSQNIEEDDKMSDKLLTTPENRFKSEAQRTETQSQESQELSEPAADLSEVQEGLIIPTNECNENKESQVEIDIQTTAAEEEMISNPTSTLNMQSQKGQEVRESTTDAEKGLIVASTESKESKEEDITAAVNQMETNTQTTAAAATQQDISNLEMRIGGSQERRQENN